MSPRRVTSILLTAALAACAPADDGGEEVVILDEPDGGVGVDTGVDASEPPAEDAGSTQVQATVRVIDPTTGTGCAGVTATGPDGAAETDAQGRATVAVARGGYQVALDAPGARRHTVFGVAGEADFEQITYLSPDMITGFVFGSLGLTDDPGRGILVVGLDRPDLSAAVGASAAIEPAAEASFVLSGAQAVRTDTIPQGGLGFVSFANVPAGEVTIRTAFPDGTCRIFPAEEGEVTVEIAAGEVSVVAFTCRYGQ